jgi:hypothetical protein
MTRLIKKSFVFILFNFLQKTSEESIIDKLSAVLVRTSNLTISEVELIKRNMPANASGTKELTDKFSLRYRKANIINPA